VGGSIRVLFVTLAFVPGRVSAYPGVNRYSVELVRALTDLGAKIRVVTPLDGELPAREKWNGVEIVRLADSRTSLGPFGALASANVLTFERTLQKHPQILADMEVLQTNVPLPRLRVYWKAKPAVCILYHNYRIWQPLEILTVPFGLLYHRRCIKAANCVVTLSRASAEDAHRLYRIPLQKLRVIYPGVDRAAFASHGPREAVSDLARLRLVYVGLLEARKGTMDLVKVFSRVAKERPDVELAILGIGPDAERMRRYCMKSKVLSRIKFVGNVDDGRLAGYLRNSDLFLFPSHLEGFGFSAVEAMACGAPIVAYDIRVNREILGEAALLVPEGDIDALTEAVFRIAQNHRLREQLVQRGTDRVTKLFDWKRSAKDYISLYDELRSSKSEAHDS
jgi:glycosyltransferase involved in cell wall biosynthesis